MASRYVIPESRTSYLAFLNAGGQLNDRNRSAHVWIGSAQPETPVLVRYTTIHARGAWLYGAPPPSLHIYSTVAAIETDTDTLSN